MVMAVAVVGCWCPGMMSGGTLFEELGYYYVGPVDGHDLENLVPILENIRDKKDDKPVSFYGNASLFHRVVLSEPLTPPPPHAWPVLYVALCCSRRYHNLVRTVVKTIFFVISCFLFFVFFSVG